MAQTKPTPGKRLTHKQKKFVEAIAKGKAPTEAALEAYNIESPNTEKVAAVIGTENLKKPSIVSALEKVLSEQRLAKVHERLLEVKKLEYLVFPRSFSEQEIAEHVESQGLTVVNIRATEKGMLCFYTVHDTQAQAKALDMAYKVRGSYAPEKHVTLELNQKTPQTQEKARKFEDWYRQNLQNE